MKKILSLIFLVCAINVHAAKQGMVVTDQALATEVGVNILHAGGNAIDAAVAVGYALAVVNPCCGNLGGGGFMTLHLANGKNVFFNFRERAPFTATANMYLDEKGNLIAGKSTNGYLAVAVPGTVMGLETALKKYGTFTRQQVIAPAISLAKNGYILTQGDVNILHLDTDYFQQQRNVAEIFLKNNKPYQTGDRLVQKDLATTLQQISEKGTSVFYQGAIATSIVEASKVNGGMLSQKDFSDYKVETLAPIQCSYRGYTIITSAPPSSGGVALCEMLNILEKYPLKKMGYHTLPSLRYILQAMRVAYADRNSQLGDPDFVKNPVKRLTSKYYAAKIKLPVKEGVNTTHYSIIDQRGNAVSVTYTLNNFFGAHVIANNTGFFLNDEMDDFTTSIGGKNQFGLVQGEKNAIQPGKHPLSSMTPTIVMKNNHVVMVLGSPGGPRIITSVLLTILNVIDYGMSIQDAVNAGRFHYQGLPDQVDIEPSVLPMQTITKLSAEGYHFNPRKTWGAVEAIYINPHTHEITGASDPRKSAGKALGY